MRAMEGKRPDNLSPPAVVKIFLRVHIVTPFVVQLVYSRPADKNSINFTDLNRITREPARRS